MRALVFGLLCLASMAAGAARLTPLAMRTLSASDPHGLIATVRAALDANDYAHDPAGEREALWWMGHAAVNSSDAAALTEAVARLKSLGSVEHDRLALSYAGFLTADQRIARGDGNGVNAALRAAARPLDSPDPARRALAKFQLCDAYTMAEQAGHAQPICRDAERRFAALGDAWDRAQAENDMGNDAVMLARYAEAERDYKQARMRYFKAGDRSQALMVGDNLAQVYLKRGQPQRAIALSRASLADERADGRQSDAVNSQADIAVALQALGRSQEAGALIEATVDTARRAHLDGQLPDLLQVQSRLAEHSGDAKLALAAEREALRVSSTRWSDALRTQEADLSARYAAREKELRIQELERNGQLKNLKLKMARAEAERNLLLVHRQRATVVAAIVAAVGLAVGVVSLLLLVRVQRRHAMELRGQALQDPLTGVDNRRGFFRRVAGLLAKKASGALSPHALLLFDFDHFKRINDRCGHPFGDIVLNVSLQRLKRVVGTRGHLARLGGEEFVALCPRLGGDAALGLAEELRDAVAALAFPEAPDDLAVTISVGVALFDGIRCHDASSWLRNADEALYAAKAHGRDRVVAAHAVDRLLSDAGGETAPCAG
jgi:diguanylate cyclase (GGDEF)-like protein